MAGAKRTRFSRLSRKALMLFMATIIRDSKPIFVTLTYPDEKIPTPKESKKHIKEFLRRLKRLFDDLGYIWRLEIKKRKSGSRIGYIAPHYHIFIWGIPFNKARWVIGELWFKVVGSGVEKHLLAGTRVETIVSENGIMGYAGKYLGKVDLDDYDADLGNVWGKGGKIPFSEKVTYLVPESAFYALHRTLRRATGVRNRRVMFFFLKDPYQWFKNHEKIVEDADIPFNPLDYRTKKNLKNEKIVY